MPVCLRVGGYRFFFWSNENDEPPHVHVARAEHYAKFWLEPVSLVRNRGFRRNEITEVHQIVQQYRAALLECWNVHFGDKH